MLIPSRLLGEVKIFTHFFDQKEINNPRADEKGILDRAEFKLLESHWLELESPSNLLGQYDFDKLKSFGDPWNNNFSSLKNLIYGLHSLKQSWLAAETWDADAYLFLRPDIMYHQSFYTVLKDIVENKKSGLCVPLWQGWGGCNDRYAIATNKAAGRCYAERIDRAHIYCEKFGKPLHSEHFLLNCIKHDRIPLWFMRLNGTRVRSHGGFAKENYKLFRKSNFPVAWYALKTDLTVLGNILALVRE